MSGVRKKANTRRKVVATPAPVAPPVRENANAAPSAGARLARIVMLEHAAGHLKQQQLADALGIGVRALQHKLSVARGVTDTDLRLAAAALDQRAGEIAALAARMRDAT